MAPAIGQAGPGLGEAPVWLSTSNLGAQNRSVRWGHAQIFLSNLLQAVLWGPDEKKWPVRLSAPCSGVKNHSVRRGHAEIFFEMSL